MELEKKNAELERFTYTVSHDLKSPLITIRGFLGYLEQDAIDGNITRLKKDIERITRAAEKMHILLDDLLELSRVGRLINKYERIPFDTIIQDAVLLLEGPLKEKDTKLVINQDLPDVYGDRLRLVEVIQNLIENGLTFSKREIRPEIEVGCLEGDRDPVFYVQDNGIGIDPKYPEKIFDLFEKLDAASEGTGVGLALVKRIVEVHGGRIWVESEPGEGTAFFFTVPLEPESERGPV
jgi:signal transduction histidine kinase